MFTVSAQPHRQIFTSKYITMAVQDHSLKIFFPGHNTSYLIKQYDQNTHHFNGLQSRFELHATVDATVLTAVCGSSSSDGLSPHHLQQALEIFFSSNHTGVSVEYSETCSIRSLLIKTSLHIKTILKSLICLNCIYFYLPIQTNMTAVTWFLQWSY